MVLGTTFAVLITTNNNKMATTQRNVLNAKIEKLNFAKNSIVGNLIKDLKTDEKLRPIYSTGGSWKHSSLKDYSKELKIVLEKLKLNYIEGNDGKRGGKTSYYVQITTKIID